MITILFSAVCILMSERDCPDCKWNSGNLISDDCTTNRTDEVIQKRNLFFFGLTSSCTYKSTINLAMCPGKSSPVGGGDNGLGDVALGSKHLLVSLTTEVIRLHGCDFLHRKRVHGN